MTYHDILVGIVVKVTLIIKSELILLDIFLSITTVSIIIDNHYSKA